MASNGPENFVKINFSIQIYTKGLELTEPEVKSLFQEIGYPLTLYKTRNIQLEDKYCMRNNSDVICFVDSENDIEMNSIKFLRKLSKNQRASVTGTVEVTESEILSLIDGVCCHLPDHVISWSFRPDSSILFEISPDVLSNPMDVTSFRFGNIINGNRFVSHLNDFQAKKGSRFGLMSDVTVRFSHPSQEIILRFKISYCGSSHQELKVIRCKFIFDFTSVKEIITSVNYAAEFYLKLDYPPKFYIKEGNHWNQWSECDVISKEIIGKCKVLRMKMELEEGEELMDTLIPEFYSIFRNRSPEIICVSMENYCIDYTLDTNSYELPFEVKYTLQCIDSLSYAFVDDLSINEKEDAFYGLIETLINDGKTVLVVEALTRLFNSYFYSNPEVLDAFESFNNLVKTIEEENEVNQKDEDKVQCMKRIILTPMRTIYLPPSSCETKLISADADISRLIKVHLRSDDHSQTCSSPYPYLSEGFGESDFSYQIKDSRCKTFFLKQVIGKRLFGENGLIAQNPYKYHGTSLTEMFTDGIILEVEI